MRLIGLAGWSGAGKTTLLLKLIPELASRGLSVSTLKHAHHAFEIDRPGKDSHAHREAGAHEVLIASAKRYALIHELRDEPEPPLPALLLKLSPVDLVIVEGFKAYGHPKLEVFREANDQPFLYPELTGIRFIASDVAVPGAPVPVVDLDDVAAIADHVLRAAEPLADIISELEAAPAPARMVPAKVGG